MGTHYGGVFPALEDRLRFEVEWQEATGRILFAYQDTMDAGMAKLKDAKFRKRILEKHLEGLGK